MAKEIQDGGSLTDTAQEGSIVDAFRNQSYIQSTRGHDPTNQIIILHVIRKCYNFYCNLL